MQIVAVYAAHYSMDVHTLNTCVYYTAYQDNACLPPLRNLRQCCSNMYLAIRHLVAVSVLE